ncbi:MAG: HlyD family secretion protein, partial [Firmicutes bacterium]|nr:HlyD family secretion protein [Bacillota bacterium]
MNVSYYPFKLYVPAGAGLVAGSGVSLSLSGAIQPGNQIFLDKPFIRQDTDGSAYVFVAGADGRLEQRPVTLGKLVYGTYYQILTGLSLDDNIAFAYDKNARAGVKTQVVDPNTFYGYY